MTRTRRATLLGAALGSGALLAQTAPTSGTPVLSPEYQVDGRVYGMPAAEVFRDSYDGPPVVGDIATRRRPSLRSSRTRTTTGATPRCCRCPTRSTSMRR